MKEIGGYFGFEKFSGCEYHEGAVKLNCARNALLYIVKARNIKKVHLPYFLCESVADALSRQVIQTEFYRLGRDFKPITHPTTKRDEIFYLVNYYGQISSEDIAAYKDASCNLVVDNVQAFFDKPVAGVDTLYSCRKYFGVPDGAYLYTDAPKIEGLKKESAMGGVSHLIGRFEGRASDYYADFKQHDKQFRGSDIKDMSDFSGNILKAVDYEKVIKKREDNFKVLAQGLAAKNGLNIKMPKGPYCYPFYIKGGMELKKKLAEKKIYVPTLWANAIGCPDEIASDFAENILPLPCDQRYLAHDMENIVREIKLIQNREI